MSRRRRGRRRPVLVRDLVLLLVLFAVVSVLELAGDLLGSPAVLAAVAVVGAGGFLAGRRWERKRPRGQVRRPGKPEVTPSPGTASAAGRISQYRAELTRVRGLVADLEDAAGRPIEAIIASYQHLQGQYQIREKP